MTEVSQGLFKKTSKNGFEFYSNKIEIDGKKYWVTLFDNNPVEGNRPPFTIKLKEAEDKGE